MDKAGIKMLINDIVNKENLFNVIVNELRSHGIKYRKDKRVKTGQDKASYKRIFNAPLHSLELTDVILANGGIVQVPLFVSDACQRILEQVNTEGLFRKAGSSKRQQEIKASLENGIQLGRTHHVVDIANILKTFFRDLPDPLLPTGNIQEVLIRCLLSGEHKVYDLMIACLLLPPITLNTLAFFMQFLHTVSLHSNVNKMTVENLAIILTPNLMPIAEMIQQRLTSHVKVVQLLIENSHQIGVIPDTIAEKLNETIAFDRQTGEAHRSMICGSTNEKKKKKRRSGSLTRMFHGLKKIVGALGSSESLDKTDELPDRDTTVVAAIATPCLNKSVKKRKVTDGMPFSAKKKEVKKSRLSIGGNRNKTAKSGSRLVPSTSTVSITDGKPMERRWSVVGAPWARKKQQQRNGNDNPSANSGNVFSDRISFGIKPEEDETEESMVFVGVSPVLSEPNTEQVVKNTDLHGAEMTKITTLKGKVLFDDDVDDDDDGGKKEHEKTRQEYMRITKSEYEAIKERVSAIETRISQEFGHIIGSIESDTGDSMDNVVSVENKYQQTLVHTEPIEASCSSTDQLAKRLSRELKIRRSAEHKPMRSPSARKIGSIRRRSKENVRLSRNQSWHMTTATMNSKQIPPVISDLMFYPKTNLKRGRPNTVQSGLKQPDVSPIRRTEDNDTSKCTIVQNFTDEEKEKDKWTCAENFFKISGSQQELDISSCTSRERKQRNSLRSSNGGVDKTPQTVQKIKIVEASTPMLPPEVPPRKTPARTPMLSSLKTPGRLNSTLLKTHLTPLQDSQSGRASIARLRSQNAGMVMAKAKLFDGMVSNVNQTLSQNLQANRRQSAKFATKKEVDSGEALPSLMNEPDKIQNRQVQKVKAANASNNPKSPRHSTPRKRGLAKSPHGGVNRRQKLRLAAKTPTKTNLNSPRIIRKIQQDSKILLSTNVPNAEKDLCFTPYILDQGNETPKIKTETMRNSPRRLLNKTSHGIKLTTNTRQQTPLKATPTSKLTLVTSPRTLSDTRPRRESPRLMAKSTNRTKVNSVVPA
ncbi:uncharacterized protein LOC129762303 isoform X2 [Toxorhynchites rutilus septentrionalis]|uniref:uncharacterized protein LOC129762303 isoform X2 n=1 Tax=Toxorhynchites rutilus septentrionalis TaxID=329112 RepID=UPI002478E931|nr:uncharacterized protein LOC129762303 isoform X2 [Toxorhynchites rutilus septentrionalis]